jgi:hypothetical protein
VLVCLVCILLVTINKAKISENSLKWFSCYGVLHMFMYTWDQIEGKQNVSLCVNCVILYFLIGSNAASVSV